MRPRDLVHMGSLCVPSSCSSGLSFRVTSEQQHSLRVLQAKMPWLAGLHRSWKGTRRLTNRPDSESRQVAEIGAELPEEHSLTLRESCSTQKACADIATNPRLNSTHVRLSPLRAIRRPYPRFTGWIRACKGCEAPVGSTTVMQLCDVPGLAFACSAPDRRPAGSWISWRSEHSEDARTRDQGVQC